MKKSCTCGNIIVEYLERSSFKTARKCGCDYCLSAKAEYISHPETSVTFSVSNKAKVKIKRQGSGTAEFHECLNCGLVLVTSTIENTTYCAINARVLGIKGYILDPNPRDFSNESINERLARRKANWSPIHASS